MSDGRTPRTDRRPAWREAAARLDPRGAWVAATLVLVAVLAASAAGLDNGFAYDDVLLIVDNERVQGWRWPWEFLGESYWGPMRRDSLYRPLTLWAFSAQWAVGGGSPLAFHAASVVLYAATSLAVLALARAVLAPAAATLAALAFAVHPVHVEAVGNVVGQAELIAALTVVLALALHARDRRSGALRGITVAAIAALYAVGLLVKEHAIILPVLVLIAEACFRGGTFKGGPGTWARTRLLLLALAAVAVAYLSARLAVIGALTGDVPFAAFRGLGMAERAWVMLALAPEFARLLLWPARLYADYSPQLVALWPAPAIAHLAGAAVLVGALATLVLGLRRSPVVAFGMLWLAVTVGLVSNVVFPTGVLMAERILFLPSVGLVLAVGPLLALAWHPSVPRQAATAGRVAVVSLLVVGAMRSAARQSAWEDNAAVISTLVADAPMNFRGHFLLGETFIQMNRWPEGEASLRRATELYPDFGRAQLDLARVLQLSGQCRSALPHFRRGLALERDDQVGLVSLTICLLQLRRPSEARQVALDGAASGGSPSVFHMLKVTAESLLVTEDTIDGRNRFARQGRPFDRTGAPVHIPIRFEQVRGANRNLRELLPSGTERAPK